jgi:hypothetical protein
MNQFRIAIVAALMATPAWAWDRSLPGGDWTCDDFGGCRPMEVVQSNPVQSNPVAITAPPKTKCDEGWTLVPVGHALSPETYTIIYKCAAVGDLRDPE